MLEQIRTKKEDLFNQNKFVTKKTLLVYVSIFFAILLLVLLIIFIYLSQDHSVYTKLTTANYKYNNSAISFEYPSVMTFDSSLVSKLSKTNTPLIYTQSVNGGQRAIVGFSYLDVSQALDLLRLSPDQLLNQIKNNNGDYIELLAKKDSRLYKQLYGNCNSYITNLNNQKSLICTNTLLGFTNTKVIGIDNGIQYTLNIVVPANIWNEHQKIWQKIEKSFVY